MRPLLGDRIPNGLVLLDTNVLVNALAGRGPAVLQLLLANLPQLFLAGPACAELSWLQGRLDPDHPDTGKVLQKLKAALEIVEPGRVVAPSSADWFTAGELAGRVARAASGGGRKVATAYDRIELISDALTAIVAQKAGLTIITEDADFELLALLLPDLRVLFYDRAIP